MMKRLEVLEQQTRRGSRPGRLLASVTMLLFSGSFATGSVWALPSCPTPTTISTCCVADQAGKTYVLGTDLIENNPVDCIEISAPNVLFEMNSHTISGPIGGGTGIHVLSTAPNAIVVGAAAIEKFAVGFQSDAPNTFSELVETELNARGILFNGPGAEAFEPIALENAHNGMVLTSAASGSFLILPESVDNGGNGIVLNGATGVTIAEAVALENVGYGIWFKGASFNSLHTGELEGNTIAGAYLGCHAGGPSTAPCSIPPSNGNSIDGVFSPGLLVGSCPEGTQRDQEIGIAIDTGNKMNHVLGMKTDTSSSCGTPGDTILDGFDGNPGIACAGNFWISDSFTIAPNHTATPAHPFCMD
jgi:Periplasmic copper-binding protein (NosD)